MTGNTHFEFDAPTPRWAIPLLGNHRYKGAKGGRGGGKSWFFADYLIEHHLGDPNMRSVCIREVQTTIEESIKELIEKRIYHFGLSVDQGGFFEIQKYVIKDTRGRGSIIFKGMRDYNAANIKSLEGCKIAWVEEAQCLSKRSLKMLTPTLRVSGSQVWFSWNPEKEDDAVDKFFSQSEGHPDFVLVTCNITDNPFPSPELLKERELARETMSIEEFANIWEGQYLRLTNDQIIADKIKVKNFTPAKDWDGPYYGCDFGFSQDPTTLVKVWVYDNNLFLESTSYAVGLDIDDTAIKWEEDIPEALDEVIEADSARPETISYLRRHGVPKIRGVKKWAGSVKDGIAHLRSYKNIYIKPDLKEAIDEGNNWTWKVARGGRVLSEPSPGDDHIWDAVRYALGPLINAKGPAKKTGLRIY